MSRIPYRLLTVLTLSTIVVTVPIWAKAPEKPAPAPAMTTQAPVTPDGTVDSASTFRQLTLFTDILERVRADYVDPVTDDKLIESALNGMLSSLDPHSSYLNKKNFEDMQTQTRGEFGGLGIEVTMENGLVKVVSPIDDTPAARAGMQSGDLITHIDSKPVMEITLADAVDKMRGTPGTKITLTLRRGGISGQPFDVTLVRAVIRIQSVKWEPKGNVGYIRITTFNEQTQIGLDKAMDDLKLKLGDKLEGYVLDLRNNPGGLLDEAISVAGTFLDAGKEVVSTRSRHKEEDQSLAAKGGDKGKGKPVVVLINGGSASASEIVAGALQDHRRAIIVGTKSFGKGSVQTIIPVSGGGAMRLTTARYYTPSGRSIQALGIEPDIAVQPAKLEKLALGPDLHEADLKGALQNPDATKDTAKKGKDAAAVTSPEDDEDAATGVTGATGDDNKDGKKGAKKDAPFDYQLARAVDLIHGVSLFEAKKDDKKGGGQ